MAECATALHLAGNMLNYGQNSAAIMVVLVARGADVDAKDYSGHTPADATTDAGRDALKLAAFQFHK